VLESGVQRWFALPLVVAFFGGGLLAADELPASDSEDSFDIEPPLLIPYERPEKPVVKEDQSADAPSLDVEKLEKDVERAKRRALNAEHLFRMGVLAKVEAEQRALRVVRLQADLENARLARVKQGVAGVEAVTDPKATAEATTATKSEKPTDAELAKAIENAHAATRKREEAELAAAELNLTRQQKLLSLGTGRKAEVAKAAQKLEELKASRN
jgi:hypothetical protein